MSRMSKGAWAVVAACTLIGTTGRPADATESGTVYFTLQGAEGKTLSAMAPDGSGKTTLLANGDSWGGAGYGAVSRTTHAGRHWVIETRPIPGETYAGSTAPRRELFVVSVDGSAEAQLTTQSDLMPIGARWSPGDAAISWTAARWSGGVSGPTQVYAASVVYAGTGEILGLAEQPTTPLLAFPAGGSANAHDWSPGGTQMVLADTASALWIATLSTGAISRLQTTVKKKSQGVNGVGPVWSPDGSRIAFSDGGDIRTIAPTGANLVTVASHGTNASITLALPAWSPDSASLVFARLAGIGARTDVYRVAASGGSTTNLTADIDTRPTPNGGVGTAWPRDWR